MRYNDKPESVEISEEALALGDEVISKCES